MRITEKRLRTIIRQVINETSLHEMTQEEKDQAVRYESSRISAMIRDTKYDNYHLHGVSGAPQEDTEHLKNEAISKFCNKTGISTEEFHAICDRLGCSL